MHRIAFLEWVSSVVMGYANAVPQDEDAFFDDWWAELEAHRWECL